MPKKKSETQLIKAALKCAGYADVSVRRNTGTASGWVNITIYGDQYSYNQDRDRVISIAYDACKNGYLSFSTHFPGKKPVGKKSKPQKTYSGAPYVVKKKMMKEGRDPQTGELRFGWVVEIRKGSYTYMIEQHWNKTYSGYRESGRFTMPKQFRSLRELQNGFPSLKDFLPTVFRV